MKLWAHEAGVALANLNEVRSRFGGDTFTMTQVRGLVGFQGNARHRTEMLNRWTEVYKTWGPKMQVIDMGIREADRTFIRAKAGYGPAAYDAFWTVQYEEEAAALREEGLLDAAFIEGSRAAKRQKEASDHAWRVGQVQKVLAGVTPDGCRKVLDECFRGIAEVRQSPGASRVGLDNSVILPDFAVSHLGSRPGDWLYFIKQDAPRRLEVLNQDQMDEALGLVEGALDECCGEIAS